MIKLHLLSIEERSLFFRVAYDESQIAFEILEKDFWASLVAQRRGLFGL